MTIKQLAYNNSNDGFGNFNESTNTPFVGIQEGDVSFVDAEGDNDLDLIIVGDDQILPVSSGSAALYINDGSGNFTEDLETLLEGVEFGALGVADIDNDNDMDLVISGENNFDNTVTKIYLNQAMITSTAQEKERSKKLLTLYPNPATSNTIYLEFPFEQKKLAIIEIYDATGRLVKRQSIIANPSQQRLQINTDYLGTGQYMVRLITGQQQGVGIILIP